MEEQKIQEQPKEEVKEEPKQEVAQKVDEVPNEEKDEEYIDEKELDEIERMIAEAEEKKLKEFYESLKKEIAEKDEIITDLNKKLEEMKAEFMKKLEEAVNAVPPAKKGLVEVNESNAPKVTGDLLDKAIYELDPEIKEALKKQFFEDNSTRTI